MPAHPAFFTPIRNPDACVSEFARISRIRSAASEWKQQPLAIGGKDVVQTLKISEGPELGRWLRRLHWRVVQRPQENERERLVAWLLQAQHLDGAG